MEICNENVAAVAEGLRSFFYQKDKKRDGSTGPFPVVNIIEENLQDILIKVKNKIKF